MFFSNLNLPKLYNGTKVKVPTPKNIVETTVITRIVKPDSITQPITQPHK